MGQKSKTVPGAFEIFFLGEQFACAHGFLCNFRIGTDSEQAPLGQIFRVKQILVQDQSTKCFLDEQGEWTAHASAARNFPTSLNAIVHCLEKELGNVQLIVRIDGARPDIVVPIDEGRSGIARSFAPYRSRER